jgi:putative transposase
VGTTRGKKIGGRKRHLLVDTLGLIWGLVVLPADIQDRDGARTVLQQVRRLLPRLQVVWADGAYAGLVGWVQNTFGWLLSTVLRPVGVRGYVHLPHRWIVERTFGWFGRYRRLSKDYEHNPRSSETWIYIAASHRMARGLVPDSKNRDENMRRRRRRKRRF